MTDTEIDLEDAQFKRARLDTSHFPHYEMTSAFADDEYMDDTKQKGSDDLFFASYDDDDNTGDFPFEIVNKSRKSMDDVHENDIEKHDSKQEELEIPNPLYVYNHWSRYHSLTLHWPNCDGKCGNKFGRLIHNILYGYRQRTDSNHMDPSALGTDNYQLSTDDISVIKSFAHSNPMQMQPETIIQMWSFIDSLRARVEEYKKTIQETKVHEIINKDIESTLNIKEVISKHFLCYSTPIRRYLISLLRSFDDCPEARYYPLLIALKDKENIICDDEQILDIYKQLIGFKNSKHYFILYQLSRYSCYRHTNTLFHELKRNGFYTISPNLYTKDMLRIINTREYGMMRKYNLELTAEEIISILVYTGADEISRSVRQSLIMEQRSCKWMHLTGNLVSAVDKMHKTLVQTKYHNELPDKLYYAVGTHISINKTITYFDVISTTSNKNLALKFMQRGTMIIFDNTHDMLQSSRFIAAPLNWITSNNNFAEWLVTCIRIHDTKQTISDAGNCTITCTEYETVGFRSMGTWRKVVDASMILDEPNEALLYAGNVAILNKSTWKCLHCRCISPLYCYQGSVLMDNMECSYCRRYNVFAFNVPERIVPCFSCKEENMLKEYVIEEEGKAVQCPKCKMLQSIAFRKSVQFECMKQYLSVDNGYKERHKKQKKQREHKKLRDLDLSGNSVMDGNTKKGQKAAGLFRWTKKEKSVKSSNLNDIEENTSIIESDID